MNQLIGSVLGGLLGVWVGDLVVKHVPWVPEGELAHKMVEVGFTVGGASAGYLLSPASTSPTGLGSLPSINAGTVPGR